MKLTVLGSGTALPTPERRASGFLLESGGSVVLVDGGSGTLQALAQNGVAPLEIDAGVYTHQHVDHTGDLPSLLFAMRAAGRSAKHGDYPLFGGVGFARFLEKLKDCYPRWLVGEDWSPTVEELPLDGPGSASLPGGLVLSTMPANHSGAALHLRIDAGGYSVVFSGDTGPSEALVALCQGVDLLVCECALRQPRDGVLHLWPEAVRDLLSRARPKRTLLTHFYAEVDEHQALGIARQSGLEVERAFDGQQVQL